MLEIALKNKFQPKSRRHLAVSQDPESSEMVSFSPYEVDHYWNNPLSKNAIAIASAKLFEELISCFLGDSFKPKSMALTRRPRAVELLQIGEALQPGKIAHLRP
jgi:hypothetical protein